jgi:hypothetical protein
VVKVTYVHAVTMAVASLRTRRKCLTTPPHRGLTRSERLPAQLPDDSGTRTGHGSGFGRCANRAGAQSVGRRQLRRK